MKINSTRKNKIIFASVLTLSLASAVCIFANSRRLAPFNSGVLSPDGSKIASSTFDKERSAFKLMIFSSSGGVVSDVYSNGFASDISWSSDSKNVIMKLRPSGTPRTNRRNDVVRFNLDSEKFKTTFTKSGTRLDNISISLDKNLFYSQSDFISANEYSEKAHIYNLETGIDQIIPLYNIAPLSNVIWSDDGNVVSYIGTQLQAISFDNLDKIPADSGLVWLTAKDGFTPHFFKADSSYFQPNSDGTQFALEGGEDSKGWRHLLRVCDQKGIEIAKVKRESIGPSLAWNSSNTALFFLDDFYNMKHQRLCRWDIKSGRVDVLQTLDNLRGKILGYRGNTLYYTTSAWNENNGCEINQLKID